MIYRTEEGELIDDDDYLRVGRLFAKLKEPMPLFILATDGPIEDFFGAWTVETEGVVYNPDDHWDLLLNLL
jgi:hypothetical protein